MQSQATDDYSPYVDKQSNGYINDINNSVYTNNSLTLVNFDLGQIYNSQKFTDTNDLFVVLPITMVAAFSDVSQNLKAPVLGGSNLCSIKTNFVNLIHQADLMVNGKTIESTQPYINIARHFQLLSEMSVNDLATLGHSLGFSPTLDNVKSMKYNPTYAAAAGTASSGNGLSNNRPYAGVSDNQTSTSSGVQNAGIGNAALQYKIGRYYDTSTNANTNGIVGTNGLITAAQLATEFRPYFEQKGNYLVWYDFAVIKLAHLFESLGKMGLVRRFDATLRLWVNTGTVNVAVANAGVDASQNFTLTPDNNSFSNTCPLMVNWVPGGGSYGVPSGTLNIVAGLYINKPPATSYAGVNLSNSGAAHPLSNCRLYYSQIVLDPQKSITYTNMNLNKKVVYRTFVSNQYNNIGKGSSFNQLINSGIVHPTGVLIVPFIGAQSSGTDRGFGDYQWKSPFDTCPATTSPCSLTNLQVSIGGSNVLQSTLYYTYENFIEQVNLAEQLTSADFGVSTGLINQGYWEWSRWYYCNVERSQAADKLQPRNVNISFNNNSNVPIDCLIFIFYSDEFVINVETGVIDK
jgi:hypothetical protein